MKLISRFPLILSLTAALGVSGCLVGHPKVKDAVNKALGKKEKDEPFKADFASMKGPFQLTAIDGKDVTFYPTKLRAMEIWYFAGDGKLEIAVQNATRIQPCAKSRSFSVTDNELVIDAIDSCPEQRYTVVSQQGSRSFAVKAKEPFSCPDQSSCDGLTFSRISESETASLMFSWPVKASDLPPKLAALQIPDAPADKVAAAQKSFEDGLKNATFSLRREAVPDAQGPDFGVLFIDGENVPLKEYFGKSGKICLLSVSGKETIAPFKLKVARVVVEHPHRANGSWILDQLHDIPTTEGVTEEVRRAPAITISAPGRPGNSVSIFLESPDAPFKEWERLSIVCKLFLDKDLVTMDYMLGAFGDFISVEK